MNVRISDGSNGTSDTNITLETSKDKTTILNDFTDNDNERPVKISILKIFRCVSLFRIVNNCLNTAGDVIPAPVKRGRKAGVNKIKTWFLEFPKFVNKDTILIIVIFYFMFETTSLI